MRCGKVNHRVLQRAVLCRARIYQRLVGKLGEAMGGSRGGVGWLVPQLLGAPDGRRWLPRTTPVILHRRPQQPFLSAARGAPAPRECRSLSTIASFPAARIAQPKRPANFVARRLSRSHPDHAAEVAYLRAQANQAR